ncbi:hypothetical protein [Hymenobacter volaticus]|uniref:Uncharacterized protein n=1 Tax=Hymenobacter volaticus TaxID=2932254 RepID=A0ABY4G553_9BACT|nr:hypothetical protein [Hymenobacter volaticus]UOQ66027.1 hypothetical protein MUN86_21350 [Hymenobacter volaticus]
MADEYAEKMSRKPLSELLLYVRNRAEYREDAILAALDELDRRGEHPAEAVALRAELMPIVEQQRQQKAATVVAKPSLKEQAESAQAEEEAPALYSPGTIVLFSILPISMMIGGGVLLGINLFRLRRMRALLGLIVFIVVYMMVGTQVLSWAVLQQGLNPFLGTLLFNVPAVLAYLLWFWPRYVQTDNYRSKSILPPIIICFLIVWGLQLAMPYLIKQQPKEMQVKMEKMMKQQP